MNGALLIHLAEKLTLTGVLGISSLSSPGLIDALPYLSLPPGYSAEVVHSGIPGVDGLAFTPQGVLLAVSEAGGYVVALEDSSEAVILASGLRNPEGIAVDSFGIAYVTEDVSGGNLVSITCNGQVDVLISGLDHPEGVALDPEGRILVSQSALEGGGLPPIMTSVGFLDSDSLAILHSSLYLWSYSDIAAHSSGTIYACNELSGFGFITESIIRIDPVDGSSSVFLRGLRSPEGICFSPGSTFPMFVVEEDAGGGSGRIIKVEEDGEMSIFAGGFLNLEDIAVDSSGRIYVSQDTDGMIIRIELD